ncbi:hypothetical protein CCACVL1_29423 [Corchorus capsularis]|uniref:Uncharacterized protein n=1 Tax=Corchorus capsularis TaxID=210143 RepID=A0A1R3G1S2_COCAP|nr:hypothetical protein CCACVL1_29423 [Corchorus capsularis]
MELKDLESDLEALRKLYGLLQCGGDVGSNVVLGERSKLLLKELLDGATERVLETHKKIVAAAEHGVCGRFSPAELENCRSVPEFQVQSVSPFIFKALPGVRRNSTKESTQNHVFSSQKDGHFSDKLTSNEVASQQSRLGFSLGKVGSRKKSCQLSKQSRKQQSIARILSKDSKHQGQIYDPLGPFHEANGDGRKLLERNETMRQRSIRRLQGTPSVVGSVAGSSRSLVSGDDLATYQDEPKREAESNFSKDVDNVVKHIESHISALRLCSKLADATKDTVPHMPKPARPMLQAKEHSGKKSELNYAVEPFSDRDELMLIGLGSPRIGKKEDSDGSQQVFRQSGNDFFDDIASKRRRIQHKEKVQPCKHSVRSQGSQDVNAKVEAGFYVQGLRVPINQPDIAKKPPMPVKMPSAIPMSYSRKQMTPQIAKSRASKPSQSAGSKASVKLITNKKSLSHQVQEERKNGGKGIFRNKTPLYQPNSRYSSKAGSESSDSEAYSLPSQDTAASTSYEDSRSSTRSDYKDASDSSRMYPPRTQKAIIPVNSQPEKAEGRLGRLRRIKKKIGLIFHHHHHHHHHRYDHENKTDRGKSMWTHLNKVFHPRNRHEAQDNNESRKDKASNVSVKHQVGHFHGLVQGLLQQLRHSKKSKPSKGGIHGHKNRNVKPLHWWQIFQRQGGVKLPSKKRVKLGFMSKKKQLRVPKLKLQLEAELKLLEEETAKRLEEAIQKNVEERLNSEEVKLDIEIRIVEARKKLFEDVTTQLEKEKQAALAEARRKQEQERREREELDKMLEENRRRVEEAQRREALEQQRKEEERYRELELIQRQKEEAARRKKLEEEEEHANQMKNSSKNKSSRPKVPFGIGL